MIYYGCPKCRTAMSSPDSMAGRSETCPECGNVAVVPMGEAVAPAAVAEPMTIEKTSKALKAQCVWAGLFIVVGFCGVILSDLYRSPWLFALGVIGVLGGLTWYIIVRVRIWWNHA